MKKLTGNQIVAIYILGFLPKGYVMAVELCNSKANYRVGEIMVDGKIIVSVPASLHGGNLPSSKKL